MSRKMQGGRTVVRALSLLAGAVAAFGGAVAGAENRTITGQGNNIANPGWGVTDGRLIRVCPPAFTDGFQAPARLTGPSPRLVSNIIFDQPGSVQNSRRLSDWIWQWGQFMDHDFSLSDTRESEPLLIPVPAGDPFFDPKGVGTQLLHTSRTLFDPTTGSGPGDPREILNEISSIVDGSMVYGHTDERAAWLREGVGGRLKVTSTPVGDMMPYNDGSQGNAMGNSSAFFVGGDVRANEQAGLTTVHTLLVREHNRLAADLAVRHPEWDDEQLYQRARKIVGALIQKITYDDWLPALMGPSPLPPYAGYDPGVDPTMALEFTSAAFRIGHTFVSGALLRVNDDGSPYSGGPLDLFSTFFQPNLLVEDGGLDPVIKGLATAQAQEFDAKVVHDLRNFLFGGGKDLPAINIMRGREHGLGSLNAIRVAYGLPAHASFAEVTSDPDLAARLALVYDTADEIDPWAGMLCEDPMAPGSVGETMRAIILEQLQRSRDGDRFWYENDPELVDELSTIQATTLADIIRRNTGIKHLQDDVFFVPELGDMNGDGVTNAHDLGVMLGAWGPCQSSEVCAGDFNGDGLVDSADLAILLGGWG